MDRILIVGAGTMGAGIAFVAARAGYAVDLVEPDAEMRAKASGAFDASARVRLLESLPPASDAVLAVEAVPERLDLKRDVFARLAESLPPMALLATNTSSLCVSEIARGVAHPERVLGMHFFNPPAAMRLVEIVRGEQTGDEAIERARGFVARFEKTGVVAADTPGFIVNRIARPYYLEALRAYAAGAAPLDELDLLARGIGFRMGPFELMDLIGLDVNLATTQSVYERMQAERFAPVALQREMVAAGRLGRKTKAGFYDYAGGVPAHADDARPSAGEKDDAERIVVIGLSDAALAFTELLSQRFAYVERVENDELFDEIGAEATVVVDVGDGVSDRTDTIRELDGLLPPQTAIFVDAYATDVAALAKRLNHPERLVGYGILGSFDTQRAVEIVDADATGDDALELAAELFEAIGKRVVLVGETPVLFLGRLVGSIVNEAVTAVQEGVASVDDVDLAMRLGTNYPIGPIAWGREIGGARLSRILHRLAAAEGEAFAPHRSLWVLDVEDDADPQAVAPE